MVLLDWTKQVIYIFNFVSFRFEIWLLRDSVERSSDLQLG